MSIAPPAFRALDCDLTVDVCVVGGGLTGITTACLLQKEGVRVALLERDLVISADTAHTTAHLTYVTDVRLHELQKNVGSEAARAFWEAGEAGIDQIEELSRRSDAPCDFERVDGYLHASPFADSTEPRSLREDASLAADLGFDAEFVNEVPLVGQPGVRFSNQARFHPRKYLSGLLRAFVADGGQVFEHSALSAVSEDPLTVRVNGRRLQCGYLVLATHNPIMGEQGPASAVLLQTKLALYTSYAIGAQVASKVTPSLFWDTYDPYHYLRIDDHGDVRYAIFGGGDAKTGQEADHAAIFDSLQTRLLQILPDARVDARWVGQVIETDDSLPFIGENAPRQFIASGFSGNGMTLGTVAAMMARDRVLGRANPWSDLFRVDRSIFHGGAWCYVKENKDFPYYFLRDRLRSKPQMPLDSIAPGEGCLIKHDGKTVAAYRNESGEISLCSAVCTHMKCLVRWNGVDRTWDCPCHGSRFRPTGEVIGGPAEAPLERLPIN